MNLPSGPAVHESHSVSSEIAIDGMLPESHTRPHREERMQVSNLYIASAAGGVHMTSGAVFL